MAEVQRTLSIIKPDAVGRSITGKVNSYLEAGGLKIIAQKMIKLTRFQAEQFYEVHKERPFFGELVETMTAGPVVVQVLKGEDAVAKNRKIMGATNPKEAEAGTIRKDFALSIGQNSVHGSDSLENAKIEIAFFFSKLEIID